MPFWWNNLLLCIDLSLVIVFTLKSTLSFKCPLGSFTCILEYFYPSTHFKPVCVLKAKVSFCMQHIIGSFCLFSHSVLMGEFSTFTFKIIIDVYELTIAIKILFSGCFVVLWFLSYSFLYDLMIFCSPMLWFLYLFCIYYRFLCCG